MKEPTLDTWTIVFFFAALQGLFLAAIIFGQKSRIRKTNRYLGLFVLLFSLTLIDYFTYWSNYRFAFPYTFGFSFGFPFFYGPILLFYILSLNNQHLPSLKSRAIHLLPGIIFYGILTPYFLLPGNEKIDLFINGRDQSMFDFLLYPTLKIIHMASYALIIFMTIKRVKSPTVSASFYNWQKLINSLFLVFILSSATYYLLVALIDFKIEYDYMISMAMTLSIYTIGYLGYRHPEIIHGFEKLRGKYENSSLSGNDAEALINQLNNLLGKDEIYKSSALKLPDVAHTLNTSPHHLSQLVNEHLHQSFPDLINSYRVEEAKKMLISPDFTDSKIIAIAFDVGFNNKANFNNAFKKFAGMSPSDYRKLHRLEFVN